MVETSKAKFFAFIFTCSPLSSVGEAVGPPGAVVGVTVSPVIVTPGVLVVSGIAVVMIVVGTVPGTVVGTGVTSPRGCVVQPAHRIAVPMMQMRSKRYGLFMKEPALFWYMRIAVKQ
jgi:hypothetical protein